MKKYLINLFNEDGADYQVIVCGRKSLNNLLDYLFDNTNCEVFARVYKEEK
jgi:hypothetical protein